MIPESTHRPTVESAAAAARLTWAIMPGGDVDDATARLLDLGIGGIILFARNVESPEQVRRLVAELRRRAARPLFVAVDQEGGHIVRLREPLTRFPSSMAIGATRSETLAFAVGRATGQELAALGIDVDLAPVLDLAADPRNATVGARSFGSDPALVARLGAATISGLHAAGVTAVPKHFPGHGRTPLDSHLALPRVTGGADALRRLDLVPFRAAVDAGAQALMVSHVAYEGVTAGLPATLSAAILERMVRDELGFGGVLVTDAMVMGAVASGRSIPDACVESLCRGADVVMPLDPQDAVLTATTEAIASGVLHRGRVEASLLRIARLHAATAGSPALAVDPDAPLSLPAAAHGELARTVAAASLTLLWDDGILPIRPATGVLAVELTSGHASPVEDRDGPSPLARVLAATFPRTRHVELAHAADAGPWLRDAAAASEVVLVATRDAFLDRDAAALVDRLRSAGRPVCLLALRSPYDAVALPHTDVAIAAYADVEASVEALAAALAGAAAFPGRLPVALPGLPLGTGAPSIPDHAFLARDLIATADTDDSDEPPEPEPEPEARSA